MFFITIATKNYKVITQVQVPRLSHTDVAKDLAAIQAIQIENEVES